MLDLIRETVTTLLGETATYPESVQIWMRLMGFSFLGSILFVYSKIGARWFFAAVLVNIVGLVIGKIIFPDESRAVLGSYVHVIFWPAMLWAAWRPVESILLSWATGRVFERLYVVWLLWASLLMLISLFFDFRALIFMWF